MAATAGYVAMAVVALAGTAVATQGAVNAALARTLGGALPAAAISFAVGAAALLLLVLALYGPAPLMRLGAASPWQLAGGFLGAFYVWSVAWGVPQLGVLTTAAALIFGQMIAALVLDATGAFGLAVQTVSPQRLLAAGLVGAGLLLSRL